MNDVKVKNVKVIFTEPDNIRLVIVKIDTNQPGLYGVGCATFTQRPTPVKAAIEDYLAPFIEGKNVNDIEDIWASSYVSSYWRNGPVLNNALSGIDQALWDIKGKLANMPVYDLLGGRSREAAPVYVHASGDSNEEVGDVMQKYMEQGFHHIRVQVATPGYATYGNKSAKTGEETAQNRDVSKGPIAATSWVSSWVSERSDAEKNSNSDRYGVSALESNRYGKSSEGKLYGKSRLSAHPGGIFEPVPYMTSAISLFEYIRNRFGYGVEILHDVHERISPIQGVWFAKQVEKYRLFFLEDLFSPEDQHYFEMVRQQCATPIAMGELYVSPNDVIPMMKNKLIDFIRIHISDIGGLTPARKIAAFGELMGIKTAWHGPGDTSPVGHAANLALNLNCQNFGIQEAALFGENTKEVFPGCPELRDGMMWSNGKPGLGIDINEKLAKKFPFRERVWGGAWDTVRRADGGVVKP